MTEVELAVIEKRAEGATAGPWSILNPHRGSCDGIAGPHLCAPEECDEDCPLWWRPRNIVETDSGFYPPRLNDAMFIAHARSDIPALIGEVRRLQAVINHLHEGMRKTT